jgi:hypothetical protein
MKINILSKVEFLKIVYSDKKEFLNKINSSELFIVKNFYSKQYCLDLRRESFNWGNSTDPSWYPFKNECPDYHRLHDNYPNAYVKQKFHGYYRHNYFPENRKLFENFIEIFRMKNFLAGFSANEFMNNIPSDGILPRINLHHYPKGGGYQAEHIDPNGPFAQIQTLIIASQYGTDYHNGGVYARKSLEEKEKIYLDQHTEIGDLLVLSPAIPHGVEEIDPDIDYSPNSNDGRWVILPLLLFSDYPNDQNIKPKEINEN